MFSRRPKRRPLYRIRKKVCSAGCAAAATVKTQRWKQSKSRKHQQHLSCSRKIKAWRKPTRLMPMLIKHPGPTQVNTSRTTHYPLPSSRTAVSVNWNKPCCRGSTCRKIFETRLTAAVQTSGNSWTVTVRCVSASGLSWTESTATARTAENWAFCAATRCRSSRCATGIKRPCSSNWMAFTLSATAQSPAASGITTATPSTCWPKHRRRCRSTGRNSR